MNVSVVTPTTVLKVYMTVGGGVGTDRPSMLFDWTSANEGAIPFEAPPIDVSSSLAISERESAYRADDSARLEHVAVGGSSLRRGRLAAQPTTRIDR